MRRDEASQHLLARIHFAGALRRRDLALDRTSRRALRDLVEEGAVVERVGVVFAPGTDWPLIACRMLGGLLTCHSALAYYSLPELPHPGTVHVAIPSSRGRVRPLAGVVVHREPARWPPGMSPPVAPPRLLVARMLRCAEEIPAVVVADAALRRGLVSRAELAAMLRSNRSGGPLGHRRLARCREKARSPIESIARLELEDAGHSVEVGVDVPGVGEVDMLVDDRLLVETDGYQFHSSKGDWSNDRRREQGLIAQGRLWVRLTYDDVMSGRTVPVVEAALNGLRRALSTAAV